MVNVVIFNYVHLRLRHESVTVLCLLYYLPYKIILTFVNIASCYYSIYKYATYFAKRHPKVVEDDKAVAVVLRLEEESYSASERAAIAAGGQSVDGATLRPRRFTITAVGTNLSSVAQVPLLDGATENIEVVDFATQAAPQLESVPEGKASSESRYSSSTLGQLPPPMPPPRRRPFSWHRSTSKNSSDSNVSPLDERKKLQFPLPSPEALSDGRSPDGDRVIPTRRPSPVYFRSLTSSIRRRSSSNQVVLLPSPEALSEGRSPSENRTRRPSSVYFRSLHPSIRRRSSSNQVVLQARLPSPEASNDGISPNEDRTRRPSPVYFRSLASSIRHRSSSNQAVLQARLPPALHPALRRPPSASSGSSYRLSSLSRNSSLSFHFPSPPTYLGSPAASHETRGFVVLSSAQNDDGDWPLRTSRQPVTHRYISALANTGNAGWTGRPRGRVFIAEDDSGDEELL